MRAKFYNVMTTAQKRYITFIKRPLGFIGALLALVLVSPIFLGTMILLYFANKGAGVFFAQPRPGKNEKIFKALKFKTMTDERDAEGNLLPDEARLTKVGKFIRSTSIDELPQLINILKGEMAFIGPRPLLVQYLPLYNEEQHRRHEVTPGMSGWAQVNGRNLCILSKKFEYDVWYVDHCTLTTDIKILWKTIINVISRKDIGKGAGNMEDVDDLHFAERMKQKQNYGKRRNINL